MLEGHKGTVRAVAISADGAKIVSGSSDHTVRVWSMKTGEVPVRMSCMCCSTIPDRYGLNE